MAALMFVSGIVIILGAFGHSIGGVGQVESSLIAHSVEDKLFKLIIAVWYFAGMCMLAFGLIVLLNWYQIRKGIRTSNFSSLLISALYLCFGIGAIVFSQDPFFYIFVIIGIVLAVSSWSYKT